MYKIPFFTEGIVNLFKKPLTKEESLDKPEVAKNYRGKIEFNNEACIGCGLCMRVCAANAITKKIKPVEDGQEITMSFDLYSCTFCGLCQDFCSKKAITLTEQAIMVSKDKETYKVKGSFIKKVPQKAAVKQNIDVKNKEVIKEKPN